ncbi:AMP-binding protein, partial [Desulfonatronospira sp.]|uniref:class I adenylate-forming enzyme family protein n=1 Tax=Desulfonatronospira sp. TaxID=1962951 RepID=UPI0025B7BCFF
MNNTPYLVNHFLEHSALRSPDKVALICDGQRLTYARIEAMANKLANALRDNSICPGDRIIIFLPNSVELVVSIFAVLKAQAVFAVINATTKQDKLLFLARNCRAKAMILPARQWQLAENIQAGASSLKFTVFTGKKPEQMPKSSARHLFFEDIQDSNEDTRPPCILAEQDLACLIYTSGSTGDPKGVMSGHDNVVFAASSIITYLENRNDDIVLNVLPLSFDYGLYQLLMTFKFGGTLVLEKSFTFPAQSLGLMASERVTGFPAVPIMFSILLNMDLSSYDLSGLRYISNTAAALPSGHISQIRDKFPGVTLYSMYGLTETKRTLYLPPAQLDKRPDSVGIPIPGTEAWVEDESGKRLGSGQVGELVVRGRHVMRGYWENPEATARRFRDGSDP